MASSGTDTPGWFGDFSLQKGKTAYWQVGPSEFWLTRSAQEWRFTSLIGDDSMASARQYRPEGGVQEPDEGTIGPIRLGFNRAPEQLCLMPMTADLPFVVKPDTPFLLPPGEEITLYISTILWLQVSVGDPPHEFLQMPLFLPSDTWFGGSTREGELCYALQTSARLRLENLPVRPHRAISALVLRNRAATNLQISKLLLPLPHMSLFAGESGHLWTESVTLEHTTDRRETPVMLGNAPPLQAGNTRRITGPRERAPRGLLTRAFGGLLGGGF